MARQTRNIRWTQARYSTQTTTQTPLGVQVARHERWPTSPQALPARLVVDEPTKPPVGEPDGAREDGGSYDTESGRPPAKAGSGDGPTEPPGGGPSPLAASDPDDLTRLVALAETLKSSVESNHPDRRLVEIMTGHLTDGDLNLEARRQAIKDLGTIVDQWDIVQSLAVRGTKIGAGAVRPLSPREHYWQDIIDRWTAFGISGDQNYLIDSPSGTAGDGAGGTERKERGSAKDYDEPPEGGSGGVLPIPETPPLTDPLGGAQVDVTENSVNSEGYISGRLAGHWPSQ